jgi:uncharacterized protein (DUF1786 family)
MRILALDVGTGTQDILLFDSTGPVENNVKLVMPSPTMIAAGKIRAATSAGQTVVLHGTNQGGGPCSWALEDHLRAGLAAYATPEAAATFDDDLDAVRAMGVTLAGEDEARRLGGAHIELRDLDLDAIATALAAFTVKPDYDGIAVACLDHGAAPPGYSDRLFRFEHIRRIVGAENDLRAFASFPAELPDYLTRARAMTRHLPADIPSIFLDTGPAAALGALQDERVAASETQLVLNLGNMHALAFHLEHNRILSLYEHHTGEMTTPQIEDFTSRLLRHDLTQAEVFDSKGHGVLYVAENGAASSDPFLAVTGPQRGRLRGSSLQPYFAAPHGDMMISGCFGMIAAFAFRFPEYAEEIEAALSGGPR